MGNYATRILTNKDRDFYPVMGPFLSRRAIVKELGSPVWDDDEKVWFVCFDPDGAVAGFSALLVGKKIHLCSAYVLPAHRKKGLYSTMIRERIAWCKRNKTGADIVISTTATQFSFEALHKAGFSIVRQRGRYYEMEMRI